MTALYLVQKTIRAYMGGQTAEGGMSQGNGNGGLELTDYIFSASGKITIRCLKNQENN